MFSPSLTFMYLDFSASDGIIDNARHMLPPIAAFSVNLYPFPSREIYGREFTGCLNELTRGSNPRLHSGACSEQMD